MMQFIEANSQVVTMLMRDEVESLDCTVLNIDITRVNERSQS